MTCHAGHSTEKFAGDPDYAPISLTQSETDDEMQDLWDYAQQSPRSPITVSYDDSDKEQDPSLGPCTAHLERISLGADGDARASIEAKKKEAPAKRTVKRARRTKKQCVPGRTYRWVENCLETKPSLDAQVFMSDCGNDILVGSRKNNLLNFSRCAYPCLSIAVLAAIKNPAIGKFLARLYSQSSVKAEQEIILHNWLMGVVGGPRRRDYSAPPAVFRLSLSRRHWNGFEVCAHNLQGSSQSKQRAVEFTVHRQVRTHGHNAQQTHERCQPAGSQTASVHYKQSKCTMIIYPL